MHSLVDAARPSSIRIGSLLQSGLMLAGALIEQAGALGKLGHIGGAAGGHIAASQGAQGDSAAVAMPVREARLPLPSAGLPEVEGSILVGTMLCMTALALQVRTAASLPKVL